MAIRTSRVARERIVDVILEIRGQRVILDADLATMYGVTTGILIQAVKRNARRFPADFMFQLTKDEIRNLKSQIVISSSWGGRRTRPYAFTEQGVAMLSSVLRSTRAVDVNVEIMRAFVQLRRLAINHADLVRRIDDLEKRYDASFQAIFEAIRRLIEADSGPKTRIGYLRAHSFTPTTRPPALRSA